MLAAVCSVSFLNLWHVKAKTFAVWCVRVIKQKEPVKHTTSSELSGCKPSNLYLVLHELLLSEKNMLPGEQFDFTSTGGNLVSFIRWEMALRAKHPLICTLFKHCGDMETVFWFTVKGIVIKEATIQAIHQQQLRQPCFAYMWCHARPSGDGGSRPLLLDSLEVTIKTKLGTYQYISQETEEAPSGAKAARRESQPKILDIFAPCDYLINIAGSDVSVKLIDVPFDCLVVNDDCRWNPGLRVFLSALYKKIYGSVYGLKPLFLVAEPSDRTFNTSPLLPSFPNIHIEYSPNFKEFSKSITPNSLAAILTTDDCYKVNNYLLECITGVHVPPVPETVKHGTGISWPLGATELNNKLLTGDLPYIHLSSPHVLYIISFRFNTRFARDTLGGDETPKLLTRYSTGASKQGISGWYNYLVFSVMNFCNLYNIQWISFHHMKFYLASHAQGEVCTVFFEQFHLKPQTPACKIV
ncbi:orf40 [Alcelaphine gammaherpesvirus 2]|uniref:Orf40 n=1 Tax=Alcelaphine gammaherpesvirus 2 TaxID=138184 RepID=A0A068AAL0_9GAMA|nr:orf40 [Alcelaphine gammaherpesvirus 2]AIA62076.1 orf40 [Alcelaphine gammaherpesvirus 2]